MTLVGKIFTMLILIMSVVFLGFSIVIFATHRNWRDMVIAEGGLKSQIEELSQTNIRLRNEINRSKDRLAIEQAARRFALAALQSRLDDLEQQLRRREQEYANLQAENGVLLETVSTKNATLKALTDEVGGLRDEIRNAQQDRDTYFAEVIDLTDKLNSIAGNAETLKERNDQLAQQVSKQKLVLDAFDLTADTPVHDRPPTLDGIVTAVGDRDLVEISIGSDDGLRENHQLEVYRENEYVGRVVVVKTEPDRAVVRILPDYRRGSIRKGDRVATRLS
jgi:predicted nuclease with TOPRIM domain